MIYGHFVNCPGDDEEIWGNLRWYCFILCSVQLKLGVVRLLLICMLGEWNRQRSLTSG